MVRAYGAGEIRLALERATGATDPPSEASRHLALLALQDQLEGIVTPRPLPGAEVSARIDAGRSLVDPYVVLTGSQIRWAEERVRDLAEPVPVDAARAFAIQGLLRPWARVLAPLVDDARWLRPHCPVCGGAPDFAVIAGPARERRLLCTRCDAEWAYARIGCPFCGNTDPRRLGYHPAANGWYRVYVCDACGSYLKAVDVTKEGPCCAPAERVLAAGLDEGARRLGYALPGVA